MDNDAETKARSRCFSILSFSKFSWLDNTNFEWELKVPTASRLNKSVLGASWTSIGLHVSINLLAKCNRNRRLRPVVIHCEKAVEKGEIQLTESATNKANEGNFQRIEIVCGRGQPKIIPGISKNDTMTITSRTKSLISDSEPKISTGRLQKLNNSQWINCGRTTIRQPSSTKKECATNWESSRLRAKTR